MKIRHAFLIPALVVAATLPALPAAAQVDMTRLVWLGDSEGAGFSNNCLARHVQDDSMGAILSRQGGASDFQQPLISEPGLGGCLVLKTLAPSFTTKPSTGVPLNLTLPRPYNNLSIGGCAIGDFLRAKRPADTRGGACGAFIDLVLRNPALMAGSMVDQALLLNPTFVVLEDAGNNYLGAVLSGTVIDGVTVVPAAKAAADYTEALTKLKAKQANGVVFTNVDVTLIPFATTIPPVVLDANRKPVINPATGGPIFLLGPRDPNDPTKPCPGGAPACPVPPGTLVTLPAAQLEPLGFGIPCAVAPLPNCNKPLPDTINPATGVPGVLLYPNEVALLKTRGAEYNAAIQTAAAAVGYKVVDTNALFTKLKTGYDFGGMTVNAAYLTGGAFSYDGFHLTSIGYAIVADEMIKFINASFGSSIPEPDLSTFLLNGNTTGIMSPPLPDLRGEELTRAIEEIWTPELARQVASYIPPAVPIAEDGGGLQEDSPALVPGPRKH